MWLGPSHRQAKHNEKISGVDGLLTSCGDAQKESENKAFIPVFDPIQSVKSTNTVMLRYTRVSQKSGTSTLASLSTAKPLSTCNYTSNNGRSIRSLEILPSAHARTHTHKHTVLSEVHRSLVSAEVCMWLGLSHRQAKHNEKTLEFMGSLTSCEDTKET